MLERGDYAETILAAKRGVIAAAQEQSPVNLGYLFYISALAKDALVHEGETYADASTMEDVYTDYRIAETILEKSSLSYQEVIQKRTTVLEMKSGIPYKSQSQEQSVDA